VKRHRVAGRRKHEFSLGLADLFAHYYERVPEGVVNDRWGDTHWDFRTSQYQAGLEHEAEGVWENDRGIGLSFGYNQVEDAAGTLDGTGIIRHLLDKVSRGGNLLLNVGPDAAGRLPGLERQALEDVAAWMAAGAHAVHGEDSPRS
jgi:alpha-L-fucosidase